MVLWNQQLLHGWRARTVSSRIPVRANLGATSEKIIMGENLEGPLKSLLKRAHELGSPSCVGYNIALEEYSQTL
jgi:hypothetical protein